MDDIQELNNLFPEIRDQIIVTKKVGQGTFSYVYLGYFVKNPNEKVALKYVIPTSSPNRTKQEIECLLNIGGRENVIGVLAVLRNKSHILILMPFINHESFHDTFIYWDVDEVRNYIKNLLIALNRVHQCGIIHRDVKPSNFLYDSKRRLYALVDFGLAQTYDRTSENIFDYEKLNKNRLSSQMENSPAKKNLISINPKRSNNSTNLILTTPKKPITDLNTAKNEVNSLPHAPSKERNQLINSQSFDCNLNEEFNKDKPMISPKMTNAVNQLNNLNSPKPKTNTPNLQKFHSFHKSSFSLNDNKCTCFNMPFVCEICTSRSNKWAPRAGTAGFRAPEVLFRSNYQTPAVDVWSAGIILLSLLSGRYPFFKAVDDNMAIMQLVSLFGGESVRKSCLKYGESFVSSYDKKPDDLKEICKKLRKNAIKSIENLSKSKSQENEKMVEEFPDSAYDLLKKLLELDCDKRLTAENALNHEFFKV